MIKPELAIFERIAIALESIAKEMQDGSSHEEETFTLKDAVGMINGELCDLRSLMEAVTGVHVCNHPENHTPDDQREN